MKLNGKGRLFCVPIPLSLACVGIAMLALPAAYAQQQPATSDQYQGVSQPPPDDTIVATPDTPPPAPVKPKPSPYVSVPPPPPPATASASSDSTTAPRYASSNAPAVNSSSANNTRRWDNTDYGIVTVPVPPGQDDPNIIPPNDDTAVLHVRDNPSQFATGGSANQLPAGTQIRIRIAEALSTADTPLYTPFHGRVMVDVMQGGSVVIPSGSTLRGRVVEVSQGHHFGPGATLRLRPDMVILPDGTAYHIYAQVEASNADNTSIGTEGTIRPDSHAVKKSIEYGAGVGSGAIVGAALAGPPGALAGTVIGAGLVTTHLLMQHPDDAAVPAGSNITFGLTEPLYLIPTRN